MNRILLPFIPMCSILLLCQAGTADRPTPAPFKAGRSVTIAPQGMVATGHPLAAQIGLDILRRGGNAIDAAVAVNAVLGLMEPTSCGIGGDLFVLIWDAKTQKLYGLNASGRSPYRATREFFASRNLKDIPTSGPLSWSVPGCVDGWETMRQRFGTMSMAQILEPSIRYAEEGHPVPEVIAGYWRASERMLSRTPEAARTFLIDGRAPQKGEVFKNPRLARTYREIAQGGRDAYYKGRIAQEIVSYSDKVGGLFTLKDFHDHTSTWVEPVSTNYRGYDVWEIPPPGQGIAALQMLNLLEPYDLKKMGPTSPEYWHLFTEAKKLAFADRAKYYTDPAFAKVPVGTLVSKDYAKERRKLIHTDKAMGDVAAGDAKISMSETAYLCVVDKDRNCVSMIQSNFNGFGSGHIAGDLGFGLQNRGTSFSLDPNHANRLEPHRRPFHTIIPAFVTKDGKPFFVFGVMGGDMQPQGHVQVLNNLLDFGMDVQAAGEAPRIEHSGSATPKGRPGDPDGGTIDAEQGIADTIVEGLRKKGHKVRMIRRNGGGYQGILIDPKTNMLHGGSEVRKDGCAVGY
jgi:gamma-glutamyltranspeptidase / glutathione hydrolase